MILFKTTLEQEQKWRYRFAVCLERGVNGVLYYLYLGYFHKLRNPPEVELNFINLLINNLFENRFYYSGQNQMIRIL